MKSVNKFKWFLIIMLFGIIGLSIPAYSAPNKVKGVEIVEVYSDAVTISWGAVSGANKYKIYYSVKATMLYKEAGVTTATSFTITGLSSRKYYYFKVAAINSSGEGKQSDYVKTKTKKAGERVYAGNDGGSSISGEQTTETTSDSTAVISSKTIEEIRSMWRKLAPSYSGSPYAVTPSVSNPYKTGRLASGFLNDGINMVNFVRYLADLPYDVTLDDDLVDLGQHGAVLLNNEFSHTPSRPSGMDKDFYERGYESTSSANLGWGYPSIEWSIRSFMRDESTGNMDRVGHRRWIINPPLKKIGFGFADPFTTTQVFDVSRSENVDYDFTGWPAIGYFPTEFFYDNDPWSVSLNPDKYQTPKLNSVKVILTRLSDNKKWTLNKSDNSVSENKEYFNIDTVGYGVANCIIFRPDSSASYDNGDIYSVNITGIKTKSGSSTSIDYQVKFFNLE